MRVAGLTSSALAFLPWHVMTTQPPAAPAPQDQHDLPTADDVLRGIDLTGRTALVTGGYSGLGLASTRALARAGATVIVPARRPDVAARELDGVPRVHLEQLDLGDLDGVRALADRVLATGRPLDLLLADAGIMACPLTRVGPGWEAQFAVNHLGHHALINLLRPALVAADGGARVVIVASGAADPLHGIRWADPQFTAGYDKWAAYVQAKTANVLCAVHLDRVGREAGVRAFSATPGVIRTPLQRHLPLREMVDAGWLDADGVVIDPTFRTPEQGAATQVWAATSPDLAGSGGVHTEDLAVVRDGRYADAGAIAAEAARLWRLSADLTGIDTFGVNGR